MTEWDASTYGRIAALQEAMAAEALSLLELRGAEHVLDLGCGNGKVTAQIAARVPDGLVVGVDASDEMIAFAAKHFASARQPNLRFQTADIRHLPFRNEFELVVSFNALHWIPEQGEALRAIRLAMKSDAVAQLRLVPDGRRKSLENVIEETRLSSRWAGYFREFQDPYLHWTPEKYALAAEREGFQVRKIHTQDKAWDFQSRAAFEASGMVTFIAWTQFLPENERLAFVRDVLDRYRKDVCNGPGEENTFKFYQMDVTLV